MRFFRKSPSDWEVISHSFSFHMFEMLLAIFRLYEGKYTFFFTSLFKMFFPFLITSVWWGKLWGINLIGHFCWAGADISESKLKCYFWWFGNTEYHWQSATLILVFIMERHLQFYLLRPPLIQINLQRAVFLALLGGCACISITLICIFIYKHLNAHEVQFLMRLRGCYSWGLASCIGVCHSVFFDTTTGGSKVRNF